MYNLQQIMKNAWNFFREGFGSFSECLKTAWNNVKKIRMAKLESGIQEETRTWSGWYAIGREVVHGSESVFQVIVYDAKTKNHTRKLSYFSESQTQKILEVA